MFIDQIFYEFFVIQFIIKNTIKDKDFLLIIQKNRQY